MSIGNHRTNIDLHLSYPTFATADHGHVLLDRLGGHVASSVAFGLVVDAAVKVAALAYGSKLARLLLVDDLPVRAG